MPPESTLAFGLTRAKNPTRPFRRGDRLARGLTCRGSARGLGGPMPDTTKETAMPLQTRYLFSAAMNVQADKDAIFNEVYDREHVPSLLKVPGVIAVARFKRRELEMFIGGERRKIVIEGEPTYTALYEIESPSVLVTPQWAAAVEK